MKNSDLINKDSTTTLYTGFEWKSRYSDNDEHDDFGRWARMLYYRGYLVCWVKKVNTNKGLHYTIDDKYPTKGNDSPYYYEVTQNKTIEQIQKEAEERFLIFLKSCM